MADKVLFANADVTLHKSMGTRNTMFGGKREVVSAEVLRTGETTPFEGLTEAQTKAIENGTFAGVELLTEKEAAEKANYMAMAQAAVTGGSTVSVQTVGFSPPEVQDGSFSDFLVEDAERQANHAGLAEASSQETIEPAAAEEGKKATKASSKE